MEKTEFSEETLSLLEQQVDLFVMDVRINVEQSEFHYPSSVMGKLHFFGDEAVSEGKNLKKLLKNESNGAVIKGTIVDIQKILNMLATIEKDLNIGSGCNDISEKLIHSDFEKSLDYLVLNLRQINLMFLKFIDNLRNLSEMFREYLYMGTMIKYRIDLIDFSYKVDFLTILSHRLELFSDYNNYFENKIIQVKEKSVDINVLIKNLINIRGMSEKKLNEERGCIAMCGLLKETFKVFDEKISLVIT